MVEVSLSGSFGTILFNVGLIIVISLLVAYGFRKIGIPAVMGLLIGGILIGSYNGFRVFLLGPDLESFRLIVTELAVAYISYDIGNEIDLEIWKDKLSKYFFLISGVTITPFLLVTVVMYILLEQNLGLAMIFGAIAMTSAPVITSDILGDYHTDEELNQIVLFLLAVDSVISILVINMAVTIVSATNSGITILAPILLLLIEKLFISFVLAIAGALAILYLVRLKSIEERSLLEWILGISLVILGFTLLLQGSVILTMLFFGILLKTMESRYVILTEHILQIETLLVPVVLMFYIFIGISIDLSLISGTGLFLIGGYFITRLIGKYSGSWLTTKVRFVPNNVRSNLRYCLITQGGIAIALSGLAYNQLVNLQMHSEATLVITVITIAVILSELVGPLLLRLSMARTQKNVNKLHS